MSNLSVKGNSSGSGTVVLQAPNTNSSRTITLPDATDTLAGQLNLGLRNKIINGNPLINQRGAASASTAYAADAYFLDRWKAGASGATLSFATSNNVQTITVTAGSIIQVVEGLNLQSGTYTLSWSGTAQGKIGAGAYAASGVTGSITGGTNTNVEFNTGTLSLVQLEPGSVATPFEHRPYGVEIALCQRYAYMWTKHYMRTVNSSGAAANYANHVPLPVPMRAAPTVTVGTAAYTGVGGVGNPITADGNMAAAWNFNATANGSADVSWSNYLFSAEL